MHLSVWLLTVVIISKLKNVHQTIYWHLLSLTTDHYLKTSFQFQTQQNVQSDERSVLHDIENTSEDASQGYPLPHREGHVTVGESSGCEETSDEPCRDQPRASAVGQENEHVTNNDTSFQEGGWKQDLYLLYFLSLVHFYSTLAIFTLYWFQTVVEHVNL